MEGLWLAFRCSLSIWPLLLCLFTNSWINNHFSFRIPHRCTADSRLHWRDISEGLRVITRLPERTDMALCKSLCTPKSNDKCKVPYRDTLLYIWTLQYTWKNFKCGKSGTLYFLQVQISDSELVNTSGNAIITPAPEAMESRWSRN